MADDSDPQDVADSISAAVPLKTGCAASITPVSPADVHGSPQPRLAVAAAPHAGAIHGVVPALERAYLRPRNVLFGSLLTGIGGLAAFLIMAADVSWTCSPLFGAVAIFVAAFGVLELCGLLRALPRDEPCLPPLIDAKPGEPRRFAPKFTVPIALAIALFGRVVLGADGVAIPLVLAHLVLLASALHRPALFVCVASSALLLSMLGQYGLWDPWETHYGEVAREILARSDWITLWWAQGAWFRSKPILIFWIEALSWGALGIPFGPDQNPAHPEWAIRLPHYFLSLGALMASYALVARAFGRRAGVIATLVLTTTPYFFLLAHQAVTDMPFVATMTIALALFGLAIERDERTVVSTYRVGPVAISWQSLLLAAFVVIALPQALYLITRNITFVTSDGGFALHKDEFLFGSAGNSGVPGNPIHRIRGAYWGELWYQPFAQGLAWLLGIVWGVRAMSRERDVTTLGLFGFYLFCSLACMAKGIPGIALPGLIAGLHMLVTRRISWLVAGRLRVGMGILIIAVTGLPWYVAMYARLGHFFTDRLLVHDHFKRLAAGVHGDTGNIGYFLQQLGYGLFPWIGLAPLAMVTALAVEPIPNMTRSRRTAILLALWLAVSFALFNAMITKLHHYIFPAVPPSSLLIGLVLDRMLFQSKLTADNQSRRERWAIALSGSAPLPLIIGIAGLCGNLRGIIPEDVVAAERAAWISEHRLPAVLSLLAIAVGLVLLALAIRQLRTSKIGPLRACAANASVGATLLAAAVLTGSVGRDLTQVFKGRSVGQERLIGLFAYGHDRPFPEHIDYRPILTGFSVVVFGLLLTAAIAQLRQASIYALLGTSFWFSVWVLDIYIADLTPHWGQRELVKRYYEERSSPEEPLIAWQLHWRGENFYTGNRVHAYVADDNEEIQRWIATHAGQRAFVLLKRSRLEDFQNMLGARHVQARSTERENNKFILVHVDL